ncbi:MAG: ornithine cyclodeaminase family protein [Kordiimonadaceae bacterium]|nr:ornithine cyclodeaminase family protein [Kordiimonadaceae bacterium]
MSSQILTIGRIEIANQLDIASLLEPTVEAFKALSAGKSRSTIDVLHPTDQSDIHVKSAVLDGSDIFTVKLAGWSASNEGFGLPASSGMILVFDSASCRPIAILQDNHLISDLRTAAAGAVAARELSNADACKLGVLGAGEQAMRQIEALRLVRDIKEVVIWNRSRGRAIKMAGLISASDANLTVHVADTVQAVVEGADILVTATASKEPLVRAEWLKPGLHITSVGSDDATKCELDPACFNRADLIVVDSALQSTQHGNIQRAIAAKIIAPESVVEIGNILTGDVAGRRSHESITISTFIGIGIQDLAAAKVLLERVSV